MNNQLLGFLSAFLVFGLAGLVWQLGLLVKQGRELRELRQWQRERDQRLRQRIGEDGNDHA